jgi:hypothetical protein
MEKSVPCANASVSASICLLSVWPVLSAIIERNINEEAGGKLSL